MTNWFQTLNEALEAENLIDAWDCSMSPIAYGENRQWTFQDGTRYGRLVSIYRDEQGRYERPVHYKR
jgi:hypothetical protein